MSTLEKLRQHRIIPAHRLRRQNFRQIVKKTQVILCVLPSIFGRYDGTFCKQNMCRELCGIALREKFNEKPIPNDITFDEVERLARSYGCGVVSGGKHSKKNR